MKVKRRVFLKTALVMASMMALSRIFPDDKLLAKAAEEAKKILSGDSEPIHIIWIQAQTCSGDSISLLNAVEPSIVDVLTGQFKNIGEVTLDFHPTIMAQWGIDVIQGERGDLVEEWDAVNILEKVRNGEITPFILVTEGSFPNEDTAKEQGGYWCSMGSKNGEPILATEWLRDAAQYAAAVVAIGTCATYGGIPAGKPNPTGAMGTYDVLGRDYKSGLGLPVINIPGCPAAGDWQIKVFSHLLLTVKGLLPAPELDEYNRPKFLFGYTVHERCPRGIWYSGGKFSKAYGEPYCMYELGCKGPIVKCPITVTGFVEGLGACTTFGAPCIGCTDPAFPDEPLAPFLRALPAPTVPSTEALIGAAAAGAILGALITYKSRKAKRVIGKKKEGEGE